MASGWDFSRSRMPTPRARSRNPGNGYRDLKITKNPECQIPKISKSRGSGSGYENAEWIPRKSRMQNLKNPKSLGIGIGTWKSPEFRIFYFRDRDFFRWIGYPDKKPLLVEKPLNSWTLWFTVGNLPKSRLMRNCFAYSQLILP